MAGQPSEIIQNILAEILDPHLENARRQLAEEILGPDYPGPALEPVAG